MEDKDNMKEEEDVNKFIKKLKDLLSKYDEVYKTTNDNDLYLDDSLRLKHFYELCDCVINNWNFINSDKHTFQEFIKTCVVKITNIIKILRIEFQLIHIASNIYMKYNDKFELDYYECFICSNLNCSTYNNITKSYDYKCYNQKEDYYFNLNYDDDDGNYTDYDDYNDDEYNDYVNNYLDT